MENKEILNLKHGDLVIINGKKGLVGTAGGYAAVNGQDPRGMIKREVELNARNHGRNGPLYWVLEYSSNYKTLDFSNAPTLEADQKVWLDGALLKLRITGGSELAVFIGAERGSCAACTFGCKLPANMADYGCPFWTKFAATEGVN